MKQLELIVISLGAAGFSYVLNFILLKYFKNLGVKPDYNKKEVRWSSVSKPTVGGISFYVTFLLASLYFYIVYNFDISMTLGFLGLITAVTLGFFVGLYDDAFNTNPVVKLLGQASCGVAMLLFGVHIDFFGTAWLDWPLTVFWTIAIMNAINLLDNMDGVTGTISLMIVISSFVLMLVYPNAAFDPFMLTAMASIGGLLGFLLLNWRPAKLYMGDTGSQFLGALLAFIGVKFFWNVESINNNVVTSMRILAPVMAFIVPIMDTSFVTFARIARKQSPFVGGKDHLTHHLTYVGVPEKWVPVILGFVSLLSGLLVVFTVKYVVLWNHLYTALFSGYILTIVSVFFYLYKRGERIGLIKRRFAKTLNRFRDEEIENSRKTRKEKSLRRQEQPV